MFTRKIQISGEEGVSLVELMVTIAFIGIIVITSTLVFTNSVQVGKMTDRRNQALNLAELAMEELMTYEYSSARLTQGMHNFPVGGFGTTFTVTYQVSDPDSGDAAGWDASGKPLLKTLTVRVEWQDGEKARELELVSYRAKKTL